jgi:hypothetical protein
MNYAIHPDKSPEIFVWRYATLEEAQMEEIELLNQTEEDLLMLMKQYKSGQYSHLADCITRVRTVRETLRHLTQRAADGGNTAPEFSNFE